MNIAIAVSGTGGHIYPGISLAKKIIYNRHKVIFFCNKNKITNKILSSYENIFEIIKLDISREKNKLYFILKMFISFFCSLYYIKRKNIDTIVGMGGYLAFPVVLAGKILGKKIIIHEQNFYPGLSNKISNLFANKTAVSFLETKNYFKNKKNIFFTGNPIRDVFYNYIDKNEARSKLNIPIDKKIVFLFGGSQGSTFLNNLPKNDIFDLAIKNYDLFFLHITGEKDYEKVINTYKDKSIDALILKYFKDIHLLYFASDLVISRAGASTITEILLSKKLSILFPYPYATEDHQTKNATFLEKLGIAKIRQEKNFELEKKNISLDILNFLDNSKTNIFDEKFKNFFTHKNIDFAQNLYNILM